jgi:VIT1/CCC1 family predicted Fe2+/Mn2+ transporter
MPTRHHEVHRVHRSGWLRAAVLGASDGIVSTASLIVGIAAAGGGSAAIGVAGTAGLVAGAMSMAAGEYVSVSSQADAERADLARERRELADSPASEMEELTAIYVQRGLDRALARQVAEQLTAHDALGAHARDELGLSEVTAARPLQAALASASSFAAGAAIPLLMATLLPHGQVIPPVVVTSLLLLAMLGVLAAKSGGAAPARAALRVCGWSALAMAATMGVGKLFGVS